MKNIVPCDFFSSLFLMLLGLLIVGGYNLEIHAQDGELIADFKSLATLDAWVGWTLVYFGFDSLVGGRVTTFVVNRVLTPVLGPPVRAVVGEKRLERLQARLAKKRLERLQARLANKEVSK